MTTIKLRRSNTPGAVPDTSVLASGEMTLNVNDGVAYFKKTVSGIDSIVQLNPSKLFNNNYTVSVNNDGTVTVGNQNAGTGYYYKLPAIDGTPGQLLTTNGTGTVSWISNIASTAVSYAANQGLTSTQKTDARTNLGLSTVASTGSYTDLTNTPANTSVTTQDVTYFVGNGTTYNFTLPHAIVNVNDAIVTVNGIQLKYGTDFTFTTNNTVLSFLQSDGQYNAPMALSDITVRNFTPTAITSAAISSVTFTGNGSTTTFDTGYTIYNSATVLVFINNIFQDDLVYTTSGSNVVFSSAPLTGDRINIVSLATTVGIANGVVQYANSQSLTNSEKIQARTNTDSASVEDAIMFSVVMS